MRTLLFSAGWVLVGCLDAQAPPPALASAGPDSVARDTVEVADGRTSAPGEGAPADLAEWTASDPFLRAVAVARGHWSRQEPGYEEEVRVLDVAAGAFTEAGADQTAVLYLMGLWPRCCPKVGLAVVEGGPGGRLVRNVAFEGSVQGLRAVPDLDGDGRDELALSGGFGMGGQWTASVTLAAFGPDGLAEWGGATVSDDDCAGSGRTPPTAARVLAVAGSPPTFTAERYARASCEAEVWEPVGGREPLALVPPAESPYVDLGAE